jgi:hypothetical protein
MDCFSAHDHGSLGPPIQSACCDSRWLLIPAARRRRQNQMGGSHILRANATAWLSFYCCCPTRATGTSMHLKSTRRSPRSAEQAPPPESSGSGTKPSAALARGSAPLVAGRCRPRQRGGMFISDGRESPKSLTSITCLKLRARLPKPRAASTQPYRSSAARHVQPCLLIGRLSVARTALESRYRPNAVRRWLALAAEMDWSITKESILSFL